MAKSTNLRRVDRLHARALELPIWPDLTPVPVLRVVHTVEVNLRQMVNSFLAPFSTGFAGEKGCG